MRLTANDRIAGSQAQVVRLFATLIILLDETFLSRQAVHRPLVRLMRICVGDEFFNAGLGIPAAIESDDEDEETKAWRRFGRDGSAEALGFEEDLVDMMCHVASRLRNSPELLIIFFRDRGGDAEAKRAFNRALTGIVSPMQSNIASRSSTRPASPAVASIKGSQPTISSPLRPTGTLQVPTSPLKKQADAASNASTSTSLTYDFPLFSYLLRFVHRESRTGELARAGLLFLVDVAFAPGRRNIGQSQRRQGSSTMRDHTTGDSKGILKKGGHSSNPAKILLDSNFGVGPSLALARYMLESDFAEVLAASLGAVYGLLPTKLAISRQSIAREGRKDSSGMSLGGSVLPSVEAEPLQPRGVALSSSEEVRKHSRLLSDLLEFTQDILRTSSRIPDEEIQGDDKGRAYEDLIQVAQSLTASIGRSIQILFLENILYPSLLECSDSDGSAVAVMTYLDLILSVLENDGPLADFIVGWLIGGEIKTLIEIQEKRKHKSTAMLQLEREKGAKAEASNYFSDALGRYTVKDLLLDHLKSTTKADASIAALRLASTIITYYGSFSLQGVLQVVADDAATAFPDASLTSLEMTSDDQDDDSEEFVYPGGSKEDVIFEQRLQMMSKKIVKGINIFQHAKEMSLYLALAKTIERGSKEGSKSNTIGTSSTGFDNYLDDAEQGLIRDSMFWDGLVDKEAGDQMMSFRHRLVSQDAMLQSLLEKLCQLWQNPPEVNVALTGLIADIAICPMRSLNDFIVFERSSDEMEGQLGSTTSMHRPSGASDDEAEDDLSDDERAFFDAREEGRRAKQRHLDLDDAKSIPILMSIFYSLVEMLNQYRIEVDDFDRLLQERRKGLLYVEKLDEALKVDDETEGKVVASTSSHYEPADEEVTRLIESIKVKSSVIELTSSRRVGSRAKRISLPPPPSATIDSSDDNIQDASPVPTKREGFARFFGRGTTIKSDKTDLISAIISNEANLPQPFAQHYQETSSIFLVVDELHLSRRSKWSPQYRPSTLLNVESMVGKRTRFKDTEGDSDDEKVIYPGAAEDDIDTKANNHDANSEPILVSLSSLLDNAVILEEFIKEIAAILQVRRSNGIDAIQFVYQ